jgi:alkanesulfonate monooxygenase SsuD/methylene tetrahydromethanopterin reductase-like flavin-dependent oxidoreductase (luciferase family)
VWSNDSARPDADGLADLAVVHAVAPDLGLGVGVVPLDRRPAVQIAADVRRLGLPLDRLRLGIGSGAEQTRPVELVRRGVAELRDLLPDARIFIAALGPRMCELAGEVADGVLLNWALPARLRWAVERVAQGATSAGRPPKAVETWTYVRAAIGPDARQRLAREAERYARNAAYGRQFAEMGAPFEEVGVHLEDEAAPAAGLSSQLDPYRRVLDGVVVRALPARTPPGLDELRAIARAAAG